MCRGSLGFDVNPSTLIKRFWHWCSQWQTNIHPHRLGPQPPSILYTSGTNLIIPCRNGRLVVYILLKCLMSLYTIVIYFIVSTTYFCTRHVATTFLSAINGQASSYMHLTARARLFAIFWLIADFRVKFWIPPERSANWKISFNRAVTGLLLDVIFFQIILRNVR